MIPLAQPPRKDDRSFDDWMYRMWKRISDKAGLAWSLVDKTGANLTDIPTRHHDDLQYIPANPVIQFDYDQDEVPFIPPPNTYEFDKIIFPAKNSIGAMNHLYSLQELMDHEWSSGVVSGAVLTDNGNGTVSLTSATITIRADTNPHGTLYGVGVPAQLNIALTDNVVNYLHVFWNAGNPVFQVTTSESIVNGLNYVSVYEIHRQGTVLHYLDVRNRTVDSIRKLNELITGTNRFWHDNGGTILGANVLAITCTAGEFHRGVEALPHVAFDTSIAGIANANIFDMWYRDGVGGWVYNANNKTVVTTTYDNNTGTPVTLGNNKFGVTWFYIVNDSPSELHAVMGEVEYPNLAAATVATPPATIPTLLSGLGALIGFVAYEKGNTVFNGVFSSFSPSFIPSVAAVHNGLSGIQTTSILPNDNFHISAAQASLIPTGVPSVGQVPTATSATTSTWQTPAAGGSGALFTIRQVASFRV